ncbi:MAG: PleD family two-component system response regulator [Candidatus Omnitrophota bacterium]
MWSKIKAFFHKHPKDIDPGRYKILVVDDSEVERKFYTSTLEKAGFRVRAARDCEQALSLIGEKQPDLIMLDYQMPGMNGKDFCFRLKNNETTELIPVIFLTGSIRDDDVLSCYEVGAEHYLSKPIDGRALVRQVSMVLSDLEAENCLQKTQQS